MYTRMLCTVIASTLALTVSGAAFLQAQVQGEVGRDEVEQVFAEYFSRSATSAEILSIEDDMRIMYQALPKNEFGSLQASTVRYAMHRYFVQKRGWHMKGLEDSITAGNLSATGGTIMKDRTPSHVQALFEERLHGQGFRLHELAVFAAALSDLVHKEAWGDVHKVYTAMNLSTVVALPRRLTDIVAKAYMLHYILETDMSESSPRAIQLLEKEVVDIYPAWDSTASWVSDFRITHDLARESQVNPFVKTSHDSFDGTVRYLQDLGHNFGSFQRLECATLKNQLVDMEYEGSGRVLLSRFYAGGLKGDWTFTESVEYLRNLGVMDETDPNRPSVMIPNYINSKTNCLTGSGFYSVCCSNECEGLFGQLERHLQAPTALPSRVVEVVANLPSDTVDAPRNISSILIGRLNEIAKQHRGSVPLHGRLFAQWLHHVYPRECPFPHVTGTIAPMHPNDWILVNGNVEETQEQMQGHHNRLELEHTGALELPWDSVEELVAVQFSESSKSWSFMSMRSVMLLLVLASFAMPAFRALYAAAKVGDLKPEALLV